MRPSLATRNPRLNWKIIAALVLLGVVIPLLALTVSVISDRPRLVATTPIPTTEPSVPSPATARTADFGTETASLDARRMADWIAASNNNAGKAFVIVDKKSSRLHAFDPDARLIASTPVLLGAARGDDSTPGIGSRRMEDIRPQDRTTPAGRFIAEPGHNTLGEDVVWVDYENAVSMHSVRTTNPRERRLERLATPAIDDNRISYGCINVPVAFYERHIAPAFATQRGVVYVLPETRALRQVFDTYQPPHATLWANDLSGVG